MPEPVQHDLLEQPDPEPASGAGRRIIGAVALLVILGGIYFQFATPKHAPDKSAQTRALTPEEESYRAKLDVEDLSMSRAENYLHQEVTTLTLKLVNKGDRSLQSLDLTVEFADELQQVVLRETRPLLTTYDPRFAPGEHRTFEISFEHIPTSWNLQQPTLRLASLAFAARKE